VVCFGGFPGTDWNVYELDMNKKKWKTHHDSTNSSPRGRFGHTMIVHHEFGVLFGGEDRNGVKLHDVWLLSLKDYTWKSMETSGDIPCARSNHSAVWSKGNMIVFGGQTSSTDILNDLYVLNLETLKWVSITFKASLPALHSHSADVYGYDLIVFGGKNPKGLQNEAYLIDFEHKTWVRLATKGEPKKRTRCTMIVRGGVLIGSTQVDQDGVSRRAQKEWKIPCTITSRQTHNCWWSDG
jgi:N-acetylneuraminic acid mutarotase